MDAAMIVPTDERAARDVGRANVAAADSASVSTAVMKTSW